MKILIWNTNFLTDGGGSQKVTYFLAHKLSELGISVTIACKKVHQQEENPVFQNLPSQVKLYQDSFVNPWAHSTGIISFLLSFFEYFKAMIRFFFFLRKERFSLVHLNYVSWDICMLGLYKTWFKYSLVISFLGGENSLASQKKLTKIKMKFALWAACKVTAVSQHLIDDFEKKFAFFDTLHIPFFNDPAETLKTNILLPDVVESGHFVFCGRISPEKRVPFLIETFKEAVIQGCSKKLYIVGEGNDLFRCRQFVEQNNLQKQIIFLGQLPYCIAQKVISVCCCLILCSRTESNPQVVLEAMSLKKPVICSFIPGVEKIVIHEETGLLFLQDRKDLFVESILKISNNEHYAQNLGASAHVLFRKLFSQHDYTEKMLDIYHAVGHNHF